MAEPACVAGRLGSLRRVVHDGNGGPDAQQFNDFINHESGVHLSSDNSSGMRGLIERRGSDVRAAVRAARTDDCSCCMPAAAG